MIQAEVFIKLVAKVRLATCINLLYEICCKSTITYHILENYPKNDFEFYTCIAICIHGKSLKYEK